MEFVIRFYLPFFLLPVYRQSAATIVSIPNASYSAWHENSNFTSPSTQSNDNPCWIANTTQFSTSSARYAHECCIRCTRFNYRTLYQCGPKSINAFATCEQFEPTHQHQVLEIETSFFFFLYSARFGFELIIGMFFDSIAFHRLTAAMWPIPNWQASSLVLEHQIKLTNNNK